MKIIVILAIFALMSVVVMLYACVVASSRASRLEEQLYDKHEPQPIQDELFCMVMDKPLKYINYKDTPGCIPANCQTCPLAVFRDL